MGSLTVGPKTFSTWSLLLFALPILSIVLVRQKWFGEGGLVLYAFLRTTLQLIFLGYFLLFLLGASHPVPVFLALVVMTLASGWIALGPVKTLRLSLWPWALLSISLGAGLSLLLGLGGVLKLSPWWNPRYLLPLAGMTLSAAMNGVSLAAERFVAASQSGLEISKARAQAFRAALIPYINSLLSAGLVSIPGMMTGQILAGVSPLLAARYQILIMAQIFTSAGLSSLLFLLIISARR